MALFIDVRQRVRIGLLTSMRSPNLFDAVVYPVGGLFGFDG